MLEHPQYHRYLDNALKNPSKQILDKQGGNPFLHITFEAILENQMVSDEVPEVKMALQALIEKGIDPHEARHAILSLIVEELRLMLKEHRHFNADGYRRDLKKLIMTKGIGSPG